MQKGMHQGKPVKINAKGNFFPASLRKYIEGDDRMKGNSRTKATLLAVSAAVLLCLFAVPALAKDTLVVANIYDARTLDPIVQNEVATSGMCLHIYDTLLALDQENNLVPMLAEKWEQIDDVTYKFALRKGVKFHNGEPFSAKDVKYTVERAQTPVGSAIRQYSEVVDKVEIVDDYTVIFKLKAPFTPFLMSLSHTWGSIVNQKAVEAAGESYGMNPVGTGPFKFKSWNKGDRIVLERNDDYWGKKPAYKELVMRAVAESINRTIELESGAVDIAYRVPVTDIKRVEENEKLTLYRHLENSTSYMGFNCAKAPWDNPKVRQAVRLALDNVGMQKAVFRGTGRAPNAPVAPSVKYSDKDIPYVKRDVEAAKKLLAEAGVQLPLKAEIWTNDYKPRRDLATIIQAQLKEVGIEVEHKVLEWGAYLDGLQKKTHDMYILGWVASVPDAEFAISGVLRSTGGSNYSFFSDAEVDALLEKGKSLPDGEERAAVYKKVQERIHELAPWVYMYNEETFHGSQKNVKGFVPSPRGYHLLTNVTFE